nr:glycosyltransferase family 39 protein [Rubellimicrobium aerolatum]
MYFWMQWGVFQLLGEGVLALTAFKNLLLLGGMALLYRFLRREVGPAPAGVATLSLGLVAPLVWEMQRALTHTALAMLVAVAALWLAVRALERGRWGDYLLLGLAVGLGTLSKLNFLVWAAALLLAALALPEWRGRVRWVRVLGAAALAAALNGPAALWMLRNPEWSTVGLQRLEPTADGGWAARLEGTGALAVAALNLLILPLLVLGGYWWVARRRPRGEGLPPGVRLYGLASALTLGLLWAMVLVTGSTEIDHIWLIPLASGLVPVAVLALWPRLSGRGRRGLAGAAAGLWLLAMVGLPLSGVVSPSTSNRGLDVGPLAARLGVLEAEGRVVATGNVHLAGNLVLREPGLGLRILRPGARDLPEGPAALVGRPNDPLLESSEVLRRMEGTEIFELLPGVEARRQVVTRLAPR